MGSGNFISGFLQGFGDQFLNHRKQQYEQEQQDHATRINIMQKILSDPSTTPEMASIIQKDFFGKNLKGKEEKQAFDQMFQLLGSSKIPSQEAQSNQANINQAQRSGASEDQLKSQERPRLSLSAKPRYSQQDLIQQEAQGQAEVAKQRAMALEPIEQRKADRQLRQQMSLEELRQQGRVKVEEAKSLARASGDIDKYAQSLIEQEKAALGRDLTPEELQSIRGRAGQQIQADKEAKTAYLANKVKAIDSTIARGQAYIAHLKKLESQKDQQLSISAKNASTSARNADINAARAGLQQQRDTYAQQRDRVNQNLRKMGQLQGEFNNWANKLSNPLISAQDRQQAQDRMNGIEGELNRLSNENDSIGSSVNAPSSLESSQPQLTPSSPSTSTSTPTPKKSLSKSSKSPTQKSYKIISNDGGKTKYKFYGYNPDGSPNMERIP